MNEHELRTTLESLAGSRPRPTPEAHARVMQRARRRRHRSQGLMAAIVVVVVALGFGTMRAVADSGTDRGRVVATRPAGCDRLPRAVPTRKVPADVLAWADGARVVGSHSLWTVRRNLAQTGIHDTSVWRLKLGWFVTPGGADVTAPTLTARQIGGTARATGGVNAATASRGTWFASTIELPAPGCYEITARHGTDTIRFRRSVGPVS